MSETSKPHSRPDEIEQERIPDELLPEGVGPAWWTPLTLRAAATAHATHKFDHSMEIKAWVVLHLMNERERLVEQLEASQAEVERLSDFLRRADETFRLIAEAAGADGTSPDDWRALVHKWDFALETVRDLRLDYDEDSSPASVPEGLGQTTAPRAGERPATSNQDSEPEGT